MISRGKSIETIEARALLSTLWIVVMINMLKADILARVLTYRINRWANILVAIFTIAFIVGGGSTYPHYLFIAAVEIVCLLLIIGIAWRWPNPNTQV
ncbi:MAG: hypothetical protein IPM07_09530 [Anaerolineales bacterium]|nr:hypothetical protein [Anaerolineales bacterium]